MRIIITPRSRLAAPDTKPKTPDLDSSDASPAAIGRKTGIAPANLQAVLDSASDSSDESPAVVPAVGTKAGPVAAVGRKTSIAPANLQQMLDSASNAGVKGQAQYHTPGHWAEVLALALPAYRPVLVDLTCGNGQPCLVAAPPAPIICSAATSKRRS